jgi:hypothetical protein
MKWKESDDRSVKVNTTITEEVNEKVLKVAKEKKWTKSFVLFELIKKGLGVK